MICALAGRLFAGAFMAYCLGPDDAFSPRCLLLYGCIPRRSLRGAMHWCTVVTGASTRLWFALMFGVMLAVCGAKVSEPALHGVSGLVPHCADSQLVCNCAGAVGLHWVATG
jgi:hypothetical protein